MRTSEVDPTELARRVTELSRERDEARAAAAAERERNVVLLQQCDELASEILAMRRGAAPPWQPALISEQTRQLATALETIRNMERSRFWRMRLVWVRVRAWILGSAQ